ncbi:MAG TPA: cyclic nucleotide-binding domain-containing protein, partial [Terracidiphilus sp.]|nr:cyclic nucleotide-binding domain-containing protein [Terracidiphilus sp.]
MGAKTVEMAEGEKSAVIESRAFSTLEADLRTTRIFAQAATEDLRGVPALQSIDHVTIPAGGILLQPGDPADSYWLVLRGEMRADWLEKDGSKSTIGIAPAGEAFGEVPLLTGRALMPFQLVANQNTELARFTTSQFWALLACCPGVRQVVLADTAQRLQNYQEEVLHRQKLISLGTLAAGLMHELNNPGSAARRAATQLRENLLRLQQMSLRNSNRTKTPEQLACMRGLLEHTVQGCRPAA